MTRVLMTADAAGGVWAYATELRAALAAEDVEVTLAVLGPDPPPEDGIAHHPGRLEWQEDPWEDVAGAGEWLLELAGEVRPDVVHLNGYAHGALEWRRPALVVGHSCVPSWYAAVRGEPAPPSWDRYREAVRRGLLAADAVVAPTAAMLAELRRHHGLGERGTVIHNGIRPQAVPAVPKEPFVLGAGRLWDEAKALGALDAAAATTAWPVELAGDAGGAKAHHARLLGALPRAQLRERMARAAVFAHPARYEPFGLAVLEAAAAGCALVLGNIATLRELWEGAALFVAPGDPEGLAAAIDTLARDEALRARLGRAAAARSATYDAARMARAYAGLYRRLAAGRAVAA
ncbi:MAG TPA: glycosyltransferase family 4 protein [Solirubrobacteraceae bacterium]|nr:glycosyltransferase family 4 protein [Solirubrobacteraceae bacterium]